MASMGKIRGCGAGLLLAVALTWTGLSAASAGVVETLPFGVVNVARPDFGSRIGGGYDYGLANDRPVEIVGADSSPTEVRIVRTPHELRLSRRNEARFRVRLGDTRMVYFWLEAPRVHGQWHVTLTTVYPDQHRKVIFSRNIQNRVTNFIYVDGRTDLEVKVTSVEQTFKVSKRFHFAVTPERAWTWPDYLPVPHRTLWD
ncbi:MAG: hypothetical protein MUF52_08570 [Syntrophobacteraceae bacterium]|jgi:hypothetical protein|nr:hypothetical protein [Syntrophobacteraceae bacterium]